MQLAEVFPSNYLKAADLKGRAATVVIAAATIEKLGDDRKLVLAFQHKEKKLVTNKTNANRIAYLYGNDTDAWIGKEIVLYGELVEYAGKTVEAIRVRPPEKRDAAPAPAAENGNYTLRQTSGVTIMESNHAAAAAAQANRVPGSANTSVDLDQEIPF